MPLTNAQYDQLERAYGRRRQQAAAEREERLAEAYERARGLREADEEIADLAFARARDRVSGNAAQEACHAERLAALRAKREEILREAGFPADYTELRFACPDCRDTGYVDGEPCACRRRAVIELLYDQSAIRDNLLRENFSTFRMAWYDEYAVDAATGLTHRELMEKNLAASRQFIESFGGEPQNLLLMGQAGTGKTFLSNCIAKELLDRYIPVLYLSAPQLFEILARQAFERGAGDQTADQIFTCDLLIIDDLGTELANAFVSSRLFYCINERILRRKSTLISTNLSMNDMLQIYSERVTSRLMGSYRILRFPDQDIRLKKRETMSRQEEL